MLFADRVFRPFENLIEPLDLPITTLPDKGPIQLVWHFAKMFRGVLSVVTVLISIATLIGLAVVWMLAFIVDGVTANGAQAFVTENLLLLIGFGLVLLIIEPLLSFIDECFMSQTVGTLMPAALRWQAHKAVENQDVAFFEDIFAGQVAARNDQAHAPSQRQLLVAIEQSAFLISLSVPSLMFAMAWQLALPVVIWIVAQALLAYFVTPNLIDRSGKVAEATSRATGAMTDVYSNISTVKAFSAEDSEGDSIRKVIGDTIDTRHREQRITVLTYGAVRMLNALLGVSIFVISMLGLTRGFVTMGEFVAAVTIARSLFNIAFAFISLGFSISEGYGTIRDAMPVMTSQPKLVDKLDAVPFVYKAGEIVFDNVSYAYKPAKPVIENLNLVVSAGEKVGLVGVSGAGKSTIVSLLLRLRDVNGGSITVDGQDVRDVQQSSLRREIGVITQDVFLLNRSIRDNVRYGATDATDEQIKQALRMADALEFVEDLHDKEDRKGLDARVGDRGVKLSGGQRQRLAIARVLLKDARILLLDEATSALDSVSESQIQGNLEQLMRDKTAVVVAHRLSTISAMDRLVVLDKGRIIEQGSHSELIDRDGLYAKLWHRQSGGFIGTQ
ncbi:UNVERIFIED_CONTAM: hypothetical protein GTU68_051461 [Idotea baltica]|nr:hypothetical protein [Idotea baltica]